MALKVTILGCGSSGGVPLIGNDWGACDPGHPRNYRTRCSIFIEWDGLNILIDMSPDLRQQFNRSNIKHVDTIFFTHDHADQVHGIDDIRGLCYRRTTPIPTFADPATFETLLQRFPYIFYTIPRGNQNYEYPPLLDLRLLPQETILDNGGKVQSFPCHHGAIISQGYRLGSIGYTPDIHEMTQQGWDIMQGAQVWIVDALRYKPHPTHSHVEKTLEWIERLKPKRAILTNMHQDLDYEVLRSSLPAHVEPAFDGMVIEC